MMELAFNSKQSYVRPDRWIASLSDGTTVFQDSPPSQPAAWHRLTTYVRTHKLSLTNLRLEAYGRRVNLVPFKDEKGTKNVDGYWYSQKIDATLNAPGFPELYYMGVGYVVFDVIFITWVDANGNISQEIRKHTVGDPAVILNEV